MARIGVLGNSPGPPWEAFGRTRAAQQATTTIPIVFTLVNDPIDSGFVKTLARPGGNLTGLASGVSEGFSGKLMDLAREAIPNAKRVGILFNAGNPRNYFDQFAPQWAEAAAALKLELQRMGMRRPEDLDSLFGTARQARVDVVVLIGDPLIFQHRMRIHDLADQYRIPTIEPTKEYLAGRGLLSYGPNLTTLVARAAVYVDRILKGARPAELPVEQPRQFELVVNL
jgi:putative ABC transport system substrate-binding protein